MPPGNAKYSPRKRVLLGLCSAAVGLTSLPTLASAQTWARGTTPRLRELVAVDRTGENNWPYGAEDVAGDGAATFAAAEQSVDLRTAYAATSAQRFWVRAYVSAPNAPATSVALYVFIDSDRNAATGGDAVATAVDPALSSDPTTGGYEWLLGVDATPQVLGVWQWAATQWTAVALAPNEAAAEANAALDPIRFDGDTHGYLQGAVDLGRVGLTVACDANLLVRTVDSTANLADVMFDRSAACVPTTTNGVSTVLNTNCTTDADCPAGGACINGACVFTADCTTNADCAQNQVCTNGFCVAAPGGNCTTTADCAGGLVCQGGQCVACTDSTQCAAGQSCAPDGTCTTGPMGGGGSPTALAPGEEIQGGACACSMFRSDHARAPIAFALAALLGGLGRRWPLRRSRGARRA